jgi:hypothetical protein
MLQFWQSTITPLPPISYKTNIHNNYFRFISDLTLGLLYLLYY